MHESLPLAGLDHRRNDRGIVNNYSPGEPLNKDLYSMSKEDLERSGAQQLPRNLLEAIEFLRGDEFARKVLGVAMIDSFLHYKTDEWERYHQAVTDWEVEEYLRLY